MARLLIVKFGTKNLADFSRFVDYARQIKELIEDDEVWVVVVSSGAIFHGWNRMHELGIDSPFLGQEELAGIGSRHLLNAWGNAFAQHNREVAQVWVTHNNLSGNGEKESIRERIFNYLKAGVVPIVNENDVVSNKEIKWMRQGVSENDRLARRIAELLRVQEILFLTDVAGVYDDDPGLNRDARLYQVVTPEDVPFIALTVTTGVLGRGGMKSKLNEAIACFFAGMRVVIAGNEEDVILKFARRKSVGTTIGTFTRFK